MDILSANTSGIFINGEPVTDIRIIPVKFRLSQGIEGPCYLVTNSGRHVHVGFHRILEALYTFDPITFDKGGQALLKKDKIIL